MLSFCRAPFIMELLQTTLCNTELRRGWRGCGVHDGGGRGWGGGSCWWELGSWCDGGVGGGVLRKVMTMDDGRIGQPANKRREPGSAGSPFSPNGSDGVSRLTCPVSLSPISPQLRTTRATPTPVCTEEAVCRRARATAATAHRGTPGRAARSVRSAGVGGQSSKGN